ncbi:MAG: site-specific integrase, partial [Alphaproteobacteria bacterium]|nr:site-specific integrase [Alphaproteobacteria bacterium]
MFYYRRVVPAELRAAVGRREIKRSLRTKETKEAKRRCQEVGPEVDRILQSAQDSIDGLPLLTDVQADTLAVRWLRKALQEDAEDRALGHEARDKDVPDHLVPDFLAEVREALAPPVDLKFARPHVREVLEDEGLVLPEGTEAYRKLSLAMLRALAEFFKISKGRDLGRWDDTPQAATAPPDLPIVATAGPPSVPKGSQSAGTETGHKLSDVLEAWLAERKLQPKMEHEWRTAFCRLTEVIGGDVMARTVSKVHIRDFKNTLLRCPSNMRHSLRHRTLPDIVRLTEKDTERPRLSPATVNKALGVVAAVFSWAVSNGYLDMNVAAGMTVKDQVRAKDKRLPFTMEDLKTIFRTDHGRYRAQDPELFWLPLLALYTGARMTELGQALVSDIKDGPGDITYLDINALEDDKRLKTGASRRQVPIHTELVRCGFLQYVSERRKSSKGDSARLFPGLKPDSQGILTGNFSKRFGRHLRARLKITDTRKTFHSFRHTFKDACRAAEIENVISDALQGHSSGTVSAAYGTGYYPLSVLAAAMAKVHYPGLDLRGLQRVVEKIVYEGVK